MLSWTDGFSEANLAACSCYDAAAMAPKMASLNTAWASVLLCLLQWLHMTKDSSQLHAPIKLLLLMFASLS